MLKRKTLNYKQYIVLFSFLFFIAIISSVLSARDMAFKVLESSHEKVNVFYWLRPKFCVIQMGNFILLKGGILACLFGVVIVQSEKRNILFNILYILKKLLIGISIFLITSIFTLYFVEKLVISADISQQDVNINIVFYSIKMFIAVYVYLLFWAVIGHGIKLTFSNNIPIALLIGVSIQLLEVYGVFYYLHLPILKFLPTALSRQIVVYQFPFWEYGSWANIKSVFCFASTPIIIDKSYQFVKVNYVWIFCLLAWYILLAYIKPVIKYIIINLKKDEITDTIKK